MYYLTVNWTIWVWKSFPVIGALDRSHRKQMERSNPGGGHCHDDDVIPEGRGWYFDKIVVCYFLDPEKKA